jgi:hypothetical protein
MPSSARRNSNASRAPEHPPDRRTERFAAVTDLAEEERHGGPADEGVRAGQLHRSGQVSLIFYGAPANAGIPLKGPTRKPLPMTESPPGFPKLCRMASLG